MNSKQSVAIILLNWNTYQDSYECLKSLESLTYTNFHVFLVDNGSTDGSLEKLMKDKESGKFHVELTFVQSETNLGCPGGNNLGIKKAYEQGYDFYWMLNTDTYVESNTLSTLVDAIRSDKEIGMVGSKILYADTKFIWSAGGNLNPYKGTTTQIGIDEEDYGQYDKMKEVTFLVGCSMLFSKELVDSIGFLEEDYFFLYEDTDYNLKAIKAGWKLVYVPSSIVYHKETAKKTDLSPYYAYYLIRNGYLMVSRLNNQYKWLAFLYLIIRIIKFHKVFVLNRANKLRRSKLILKGAFHGLQNRTGQYT